VRSLVLVANPYATRVTPERLEEVEQILARTAEVTVVETAHPQHATELVRDACSGGCDAVVVFSGDGGFNEALNGLGADVPIGFLPGGGTSVLVRALGLPPDPVAAATRIAEALEQERTRRITLGRVNGRRFAFSAGIGLDAAAVRRVDDLGRREDGKRPGDLAYALAVVRALAAERMHVEPKLEVRGYGRAACAFVANGAPYTYAKGVPLAIVPDADFELGLDLVAPVRIRRRSVVRLAYTLLSGRARDGFIYAHDVDRLEVSCDEPMPLQVDGEDLGDVQEALFQAERGAVAVLN
jgi:diacylglycerol kinase family enzyme